MRILFAGSPAIAIPALEAVVNLVLSGVCELAGVLTNPDTPKGRHGAPEPTEIGQAVIALSSRFDDGKPSIPVLKREKLDGQARDAVAALKPDLLVSFAYGRIFGPRFLALFPHGGINVHPSLLPKYRGPTPIQAAILHRDTETGITIQHLAREMDAGDILAQETFPLTGRETAAGLSDTAAQKGAALLINVIQALARAETGGGGLEARPQNPAEASYCSLITREDGRLDWNAGAWDIDARVRAFTPWPLCLTRHGENELYILEGRPLEEAVPPTIPANAPPGTVLGIDKNRGILIQTGDGIFAAERLQYRTKKALEWRAFLNGAQDFIGSHLTER
ncbi:methionyl-tRNA formyltransferase [Spirochaetia bacterium]|nr:methionyl-tRNA formyltransferase [Spirochaetia bacterium]